MADTVNDNFLASNYSGIHFMPPTAAGKKGEETWGLPVPRTGSPRPRQGDAVPLHPLLKTGEEKVR